jgi:hypothetical protein
VARPRAADDFATIRARMEELRRERDRADDTETDVRSVRPARLGNSNPIVISLRRLRNLVSQPH